MLRRPPTDLSIALQEFAIEAILEALPAFSKQISGFDHLIGAHLHRNPYQLTTAHHPRG